MKWKIKPSEIHGDMAVPPSKSHTLRALLFALMGGGESVVRNYLMSQDTLLMIDAVTKFGADVKFQDGVLRIMGVDGDPKVPNDIIDAGNSGIILRFCSAIAALLDHYVVITGDETIRSRRTMQPFLDTLKGQNLFAESTRYDGYAPVIIKGPLKPGVMAIEGMDSQPVSALLIASSFLQGSSEIYVMNPGERPWVDMTLSWLSSLDIPVENYDFRRYKVHGNARYSGFDVQIPGDFGTAAFLIAAAMVTEQEVTLRGLDIRDCQGDKKVIDVCREMGADIEVDQENHKIVVDGRAPLRGIKIDVNDFIDALPILSVVACFAKGYTELTGARVARGKESDRIQSMSQELRKMGAYIEEKEDGMVIESSLLQGTQLNCHKDHRVALSLIVAAFGAIGDSLIEGVECIAKTYPTFFHDFTYLGGNIH